MCTAASRLPCPAHARRHRGRSGSVLVHGCVRKNHLLRRARPAAATLRLPCAPPPALNDRTSARPPRAIYLRRDSSGEQGGQQGPAPLTRKEEVVKLPAAPLPCRAPISASRDALQRRQQEAKRDWGYKISIRETKPSVASMNVFTDGHRLSIQKQPPAPRRGMPRE